MDITLILTMDHGALLGPPSRITPEGGVIY